MTEEDKKYNSTLSRMKTASYHLRESIYALGTVRCSEAAANGIKVSELIAALDRLELVKKFVDDSLPEEWRFLEGDGQ